MLTAAPRRSSPSKTPGVSRLAKPGFHGGFDEFLISASLIMGTRKCSESVEYCRKNAPLTHQKDMCEWKKIHGFDVSSTRQWIHLICKVWYEVELL